MKLGGFQVNGGESRFRDRRAERPSIGRPVLGVEAQGDAACAQPRELGGEVVELAVQREEPGEVTGGVEHDEQVGAREEQRSAPIEDPLRISASTANSESVPIRRYVP